MLKKNTNETIDSLFSINYRKIAKSGKYSLSLQEKNFKTRLVWMNAGNSMSPMSHIPEKTLKAKIESMKKELLKWADALESDALIHKGVVCGLIASVVPLILLNWFYFKRLGKKKFKAESLTCKKKCEKLKKEIKIELQLLKNEEKKAKTELTQLKSTS